MGANTLLLRHEIIAASAAGVACTVVGHPLDTIKVHMQTATHRWNHRGLSALRTAADLLRKGALFRGMTPPMANQVIINVCMFGVFRSVKDFCGDSLLGGMISGLVAGFATASINTPTDFVKIQAQLRGVDSWTVLKNVIRTQPTRAFHGHVATMTRNGIFTAVYLGLYDAVQPKGFLHVCVAGSVTGALAWITSFPVDTVKSVIQRAAWQDKLSMRQAAWQIYQREQSWRSFYWGCGPSTIRAALVTSLRMVVYERIMGIFRSMT